MATTWNGRISPSSTWSKTRLGGAYLTNTLGEYIVTSNSERIVVIVPGGELPFFSWDGRSVPTTSWTQRVSP